MTDQRPETFSPPPDGLGRPWSASDQAIPRRIVRPLQDFLHTEVAGGALVLGAAVIALVWVNSPLGSAYHALWHTPLEFRLGPLQLGGDLHHWVNDLLMALFFFVVGLEIKRELILGELRDPKAAALPVICALGGMIVPAALYLALAAGTPAAAGWGIPMATDIAFSLGVLALLGARVPPSLKVFLLTLAIADDIGAILVIALFYSGGIAWVWLGAAAGACAAVVILQRIQVRSLVPYLVLAAGLWLSLYKAGIHPTIAGVVLGLLTPVWPFHKPAAAADAARGILDGVGAMPPGEARHSALLEVAGLAREAVPPLARLQAVLHPWSAWVVLPIFALANAGVSFGGMSLATVLREPAAGGVILGLVVGKPVGILAAAALAVVLRLGRLPTGADWRDVAGVGALAGIGFTVSIFIDGLAFADPIIVDAAKMGILLASLAAGVLGAAILGLRRRSPAA
ncbi:MAG TPA: Na+/H+ antiporter NhaA [Acidobacteriota bacterium]|nr:Na+/H+ antiporter NhaA [Acidobacteriota bacterium]